MGYEHEVLRRLRRSDEDGYRHQQKMHRMRQDGVAIPSHSHHRAHQKDDQVLLVHARNFKGNFDSLVAGFVETGESLEKPFIVR